MPPMIKTEVIRTGRLNQPMMSETANVTQAANPIRFRSTRAHFLSGCHKVFEICLNINHPLSLNRVLQIAQFEYSLH